MGRIYDRLNMSKSKTNRTHVAHPVQRRTRRVTKMLATILSPTVSTDKADLNESAKKSTNDETGSAQHDQLCSPNQQASSSAATKETPICPKCGNVARKNGSK